MRTSKILAVTLPLALAGCNEFFGDDSDDFYTPPPPPPAAAPVPVAPAPAPISPAPAPVAPAPAPSKPASKDHEGCGCPVKPEPAPSSTLSQPTAVSAVPVEADAAWFPSEGHLVYAGDLVMELKTSKHGINPSHEEMVQYLQANMKRFPRMGVNAAQAEKILEELGL